MAIKVSNLCRVVAQLLLEHFGFFVLPDVGISRRRLRTSSSSVLSFASASALKLAPVDPSWKLIDSFFLMSDKIWFLRSVAYLHL